ncbi:MAG: SPASM domain-containing protein, partial [Candidatus Staskawiczbacteria bacterium]|nr:SPASM domain-containing protein [Candidatus Staskawiczbacteria bacterium]
CITKFGKKDPLWALLDWELGIFKPAETKLIAGGCNIGGLLICILHDGLVLGCRRVPFPIGKVPEQKLIEIFIQSEKLNEMRQIRGMQKCRECSLLNYCRGCRAVAYGYCGDFFASDPQCWL